MKSEFEIWLKPQEINFAPQTLAEEVIQNVITLCTTAKYSVPMDREVGINAVFLDEPVNTVRARFTQEVIMAVRKFEPRAEITRITFDGDLDGHVYPRVLMRIKEA